RLRLRQLLESPPHALGVAESVVGRLHRSLCATLCNGGLARLANRLTVKAATLKRTRTALTRFRQFEILPQLRHTCGMTTTIRIDGSNRVVLSRDLRRAAGVNTGQILKVSAVPGRILLEAKPNSPGKI